MHAHAFSASCARAHRGGRRHLHHRRGLAGTPAVQPTSSRGASTRIDASAGMRAALVRSRLNPMLSTILNAFQVADIRKKIAFTAGMLLIYRLGSHVPVPGVNLTRRQQHPEGVRRRRHPQLPEPVLRRRPVQTRDLRAGHHALHHLLDHPAAAAGRGAVAGEALQGRRGRPGAHHPVHALSDRRPRVRPVDRLRLPVPHAAGQSRRKRHHALRLAAHLPDRHLPDRRLRAADVDRRADHPARHRQRHLAADLRLDRLAPAQPASRPGGPRRTRSSR